MNQQDRDTIVVTLGKVGPTVIPVFVTPLIVRLLTKPQYGDYAFIITVATFLGIIANFGIPETLRKYLGESREHQDWEKEVIGFFLWFGLLIAAAIAVFLLLLNREGLLSIVISPELTQYLLLILALVGTRQLETVVRFSLLGLGFSHISEILPTLRTIIFSVVAIGLLYLGEGVSGVLYGHLVGYLTIGIGGLLLLLKLLGPRVVTIGSPSGVSARSMASLAASTFIFVFFITSIELVDVMLLRILSTASETALYKAALTLAKFLWIGAFAAQTAAVHNTSDLWNQNQISKIETIATVRLRYLFAIACLMGGGLIVLARPFLSFYYGAGYSVASPVLQVLVIGAIAFTGIRVVLGIETAQDSRRELVLATGGALIVNLILNTLLIPEFGARGAAVGTTLSYISLFIFHIWSARSLGFDPLSDARLLRTTLAATVMVGFIFPLRFLISSDIVLLIIVPPIGLLVFFAASYYLDVVPNDHLQWLVRSTTDKLRS